MTVVAVGGLLLVPGVSDAAPKKTERTVTLDYVGPCDAGVDGAHGGPASCPTPSEIAEVVQKGEAYVTFSAEDAGGGTIGLRFYNTSDFAGTVQSFCGTSGKALKVKSGQEMAVKTSIDPNCGAVPTQGTLTMTFSNLP